jgi:mitogen-activated protein kinase 7
MLPRPLDSGKYVAERMLGKGTHAVVWAARQSDGNGIVAVKEVYGAGSSSIDLERLKRAYREVTLLRHFRGHDNITQLLDAFRGQDCLYLVLAASDTDLAQQLKSRGALSRQHRQLFTYQLLRALKALHSARVLHRDLKPQNVLLSATGELKLCDFGTGRDDEGDGLKMSALSEVGTLAYRPPEGFLGEHDYAHAIDIWGVGCILAEMALKSPLITGNTPREVLRSIIQQVGRAADEELSQLFPHSSPSLLTFVRGLPKLPTMPLTSLMNAVMDGDELDLLQGLLCFVPGTRFNVESALAHPFLGEYHDGNDEPSWPLFSESSTPKSATLVEHWNELLQKAVASIRMGGS